MLTYLIILLDKASVSYCGYEHAAPQATSGADGLMPIETLRKALVWAMKENVNVQFVYPDYQLSAEHNALIEQIDHVKIKPEAQADGADVVVLTEWKEHIADCADSGACIVHASRQELVEHEDNFCLLLKKASRVNVVLTDVAQLTDKDVDDYARLLDRMGDVVAAEYQKRHPVQLNLLTDRLLLEQMNNCGAGETNLTLAPNGRFYLCPAFYYDDETLSVGSLDEGLHVPNQQLLRLDHAPLCRRCDAYHCRRCVWMNERLTGDQNTPSHQQCVAAHVERNASRLLQQKLQRLGIKLEDSQEIVDLDYLDPMEIVNKW